MANEAQYGIYPSLRGKAVIVTGGASGIGEAFVAAFAAQGARVGFLDLQQEAGEQLADRVAATGAPPPVFLPCDLTDIAALQAAAEQMMHTLGSVDVLVNNASNDTRHAIEEVTPELWDRTIAVNLKHQFFMTAAVLPTMRAAQRGSIINMSSISWMIPSVGMPVYITAKAAIVGMTRTLAHEVGEDNIRVNCVLPGAIMTERQQRLWFNEDYKRKILSAQALKRLIEPEEVARLVLFLAADDSASITSQSYILDGGWM
jgi:NAD(P)-dependent dehydrogenase (short-subunit alcohol dehydrogenase family)